MRPFAPYGSGCHPPPQVRQPARIADHAAFAGFDLDASPGCGYGSRSIGRSGVEKRSLPHRGKYLGATIYRGQPVTERGEKCQGIGYAHGHS